LPRLSIFAGSFSLEAVEAVCGEDAPEPLGTLLELVDSSLVRFEAGEATGRYRLLETIREYARERFVESGEEPAVEARYRAYYSQLVGELSDRLQGSEQHAWIACMAREQDNLRELMARAKPPDRLRLCATLWQFWFLRGQSSEGFRWLMESLEGDPALIVPSAVRGTALYGAGNFAIRLGNREGAARLLREALVVQEQCGLPAAQARTLNSLGAMALEHGDYSEARVLLEQSLHLLGEARDGSGQGHCMANLAAIALAQEDLDAADTLLDACIPLLRKAGAEQALARCLNNQGIIAKNRGELDRSAECHAQGLEIHRRLGDRGGIALTLSNLADLEAARGDFGLAIQQFREALELWDELESTSGVAYTLNGLARLAARRDPICAAVLFGAAQALREALQFPLPPLEQAGQVQVEQEVRAALGEAQAKAQWKKGEQMTWRQTGEYARAWAEAEEDPCG
jgi:non-specific serine/threonine protein kinase